MFARIPLLLAFALVAVSTGCRKKTAPVDSSSAAPAGPSPIVLPAGTRPPGAVTPAPAALATQLNNALHSFLESKGRMPHDINELATAKLMPSVPPPPPGRKYAIDANRLEVLLVSQ
jgi:hypothetical protein